MEELDYEYEAQNQRSFARAYRDHPFIYVPEVITRLSRRRVLVTELVEGIGFEQIKELPHEERSRFGEIVFRGSFGSIYHLQHFNADPHPGNYILMDDGRVAFLDFGMTKKLDREQIVLEQRAFDAASRDDPEAFRAGPARPRLHQEPLEARRRAAAGAHERGRRLVHRGPRDRDQRPTGDEDHRVDQRPALGVLRPDAARVDAGRRADGAADGNRRRRRARPAAGEAQLAPDHARVGLRRRAGDRARRAGVGVLRGKRRDADARTCRAVAWKESSDEQDQTRLGADQEELGAAARAPGTDPLPALRRGRHDRRWRSS